MTYRLLLVLGILVGYFLTLSLSRKENIDKFKVSYSLFFISLIIAFLAKIFGYIFFGGSFKTLFSFSGETTIFGPISLILFLYYLSTFLKNDTFKKFLPLLVIYLLTIQCFGKLGCHFAGCCYGIPGDNFFCFVLPKNISKYYNTGVKLFPIQLIESIFLSLFLCLIIYLFVKFPSKRNLIPFYYLSYYSIHRFFSEFLRSDYPTKFFFFKTGQLLAIAVFFLTLLNFLIIKRKNLKINV